MVIYSSKIFQFLNQPYPFEYSVKKNLWVTIGAALFVTFFLFLFKPFGLHGFDGMDFLILCLQFGLVTGAVMAAYYFLIIPLFPNFFSEGNWTVIKHIIWVATLLIGIAIANTVLMYVIDLRSFSWSTLLASVGQVTALGIIISVPIVFLDYLRHFKANQKEAKNVTIRPVQNFDSNGSISLISENNKEHLYLKTDELFYLTSADNYVEVIYQSGNKISQKLLRGTLQRAEEQIDHPSVIRCHRSYIVNLWKVVAGGSNAQGYELRLRGLEKTIPVSRSYKKDIMQILKRL